ncbi:sensor histidine kinase [Arenibacter latericius]|uniref:sensor histidine kinase n=1 Tax=Arenibacter latericius TaxID=86104 RepID=UPI00041B13AB|nr:histidine kinase [Arenibacter latericius]MDX1364140.1 histidine kinase [Arenibacter latericius]
MQRVKQVKLQEILKIAILIAVLVTLPLTLSLFKSVWFTDQPFLKDLINDFILKLLFFFLFSWIALQFNTIWIYKIPKENKFIDLGLRFVGNLILLIVTTTLFSKLNPYFVDKVISEREAGFVSSIFIVVHIIILFISRILRLQIIQRESVLENEYLKQQNLENELTALKNQINPHFLFNSLNSLNYLIRDNKEAALFVKKLSFMYRYILQSGDRNLVLLKEELKFLESYTYLIKTRYRNRFLIEINIDETYLERRIPPLALQLLVENAVKHNEISEANPLKVIIYSDNDSLIIENKVRARSSLAEGTGSGLLNLYKRYYMIRKQKIVIDRNNEYFRVKLPLNKMS